MKQEWIAEFGEILRLWKGKEEKYLTFSAIYNEMSKKGWYDRKVIRRLDEMIRQHLMEKNKKGKRGALSLYKPTIMAHEFDAYLFFEKIRDSSKKTGLLLKEDESLLIYGMPSREKLTKLENSILNHIIGQIENGFNNLFLLKQSIEGREKVGQPLEAGLITNFVSEIVAEHFGNMITTQAELQAAEQSRKGKFYGLAEMILQQAKKSNIDFEFSEELIKQEKKLMDCNVPRLESTVYVPKGNGADLAILETLSPSMLAEFELDPYGQLQKLLESWEPADFKETENRYVARTSPIFDDADIFYIAQTFVRQMTTFIKSEESLTIKQIEQLSDWGWLTLKLERKNQEKLIRSIYHFWREEQRIIKSMKEPGVTLKIEDAKEPISKIEEGPFERITPEVLDAVKTKLPARIERKFAER